MTIDDLKAEISSVISSDGCSAEFYFLLDSGEGPLCQDSCRLPVMGKLTKAGDGKSE